MKYLDYHEKRKHGAHDFPVAFYHLSPAHPRYEMPYHWHKEYELLRVIKGSFSMIVDDRQLPLVEGDMVLLQDGVLHGGAPKDCVYECIVFDPNYLLVENRLHLELIDKMINHQLQIVQQLPKNNQALTTVVNQAFDYMSHKPLGFEFMTKGFLLQLLGLIINNKLYTDAPENFEKVTHQIIPLKKVLAKIESDYASSLTLDDLAKVAGMNPRYFCRYFKKLTQKSPIEYLNYYRIECSCEQLMSTSASITGIALNCGFSESGYFIRTFKKHKGTTPKRYRSVRY